MYDINSIDQRNDFLQNKHQSKSQNKLNYLTDSSCSEIQKLLRQDYFSRLQKASLNNLINYVTEDDPNFKTNKNSNMNLHLEEMHQKPIKYAAKQILYSDRVRKNNYNRIKKHPRKNLLNINDSKTIPVLKNAESLQDLIQDDNEEDKRTLVFKPKNVYKDKYPITYDLNYIDEVENKFIKPYLNNNNVVYHEYIVNKKSKTPFNFIIG